MITDHQLFDSLLEPVFVLNENAQILYCNETAALLTDQTPRKLMRSQPKFNEVFQLSEPIEALSKLSEVTDPTPYKEVSFPKPDGENGKVQITLQRLGESPQWIVFVRDVTLEERLQKKYRAELDAKEGVIEELKKAQVELENYSRNLEKMVEERTVEIRDLNQKLKALLDSLNQGFLIFDTSGSVWEVTSKACETILEMDPRGKKIWDVLGFAEDKQEGFRKWMFTLFGELLPFEDMASLGPKFFPHSQGRNIKLDYYPIRDAKNEISGVVLVSTDITELVQAQNEAEKEKANSQFILKMFKQRRFFLRFFEESKTHMQELLAAVQTSPGLWDTDALFRILHTLKGGASSFSVKPLADLSHLLEDQVLKLKNEPRDFNRETWDSHLKKLVDAFKEFTDEVDSLLGQKANQAERDTLEIPRTQVLELIEILSAWSKTQDYAKNLEQKYLLEPALDTFSAYSFIVEKTAHQLGKKIAPLKIETYDLRWLPRTYSSFLSTLVHVFRNAVDHGLESPTERLSLGKPEEGTIQIQLKKWNNEFELCIQDDGGGINPFKIKQKLEEKGMQTEGLNNQQLLMQIFEPQFSTKDQVTEISGRGVGLDAVKIEIEKLGGRVSVTSKVGQGTQFTFYWPADSVVNHPPEFKKSA